MHADRHADDDELVDELRRVVGALDPVPQHAIEAAEAALDWRTIDDELAELLHDSSAEPALAGVRAEASTRVLSFAGERVRVEVEVSGSGRDRTLDRPARPRGERAGRDPPRRPRGDRDGGPARPLQRRGRAGRERQPALPARRAGASSSTGHAVAADLTEAAPDLDPSPAALAAEAYRVVVDDPQRARVLATAALSGATGPGRAEAASAAHRALGMAALELDDAETAIRHFERAVDAGRKVGRQREAEARMSLAFALVGQGSTRRALRQADLATRVTGVSDRGPLHLQHAIILERLGTARRGAGRLPAGAGELPPQRRSQRRGARAVRPRRAADLPRRAGGGGGRPAPVRRALRASSASR